MQKNWHLDLKEKAFLIRLFISGCAGFVASWPLGECRCGRSSLWCTAFSLPGLLLLRPQAAGSGLLLGVAAQA